MPPRGPGLALLLLLLLLPRGSDQSCPTVCLCTADTLSCASSGLSRLPRRTPSSPLAFDLSHNQLTWLAPGGFAGLPRLETLRLAHNQLTALGPDVFLNASGLRRLDLSSNRLQAVAPHDFRGLWRLEELALFDNRIAAVDGAALDGLSSLRKAYFSLNRLARFPFASVGERSHPFLALLDLSSNRLWAPPWEEVRALPGSLQRGLFLHNNSLRCDCAMWAVFLHWERQGFGSLRDFREEHVCAASGAPRTAVRFLASRGVFRNCTAQRPLALPAAALLPAAAALPAALVVLEGRRALLDCPTSPGSEDPWFVWLTPNQGYVNRSAAAAAADDPVSVFPNGTLEIAAARLSDSGVYVCTAVDAARGALANATREVSVTVRAPDGLGTGYTTLLGCAATTLVILVYLFLTPCQCECCSPPAAAAAAPTDGPADRGGEGGRVAFLEPLTSERQRSEGAMATGEGLLPAQWCWDSAVMNETAFLDAAMKV